MSPMCVCVCVLYSLSLSLTLSLSLSLTHTHYIHIYIYIPAISSDIYTCNLSIHMCVCMRERKREREEKVAWLTLGEHVPCFAETPALTWNMTICMALGEREIHAYCVSLPFDIRTALVFNIAAPMKCSKDCPWIGQAFQHSSSNEMLERLSLDWSSICHLFTPVH